MLLSAPRFNWINELTKGFKDKMFFYFVLELLSIVCSLGFVFFSKKAVDYALGVDFYLLDKIILGVVFCSFLSVLCKILSQRISQLILIGLTLKLQNNIIYKQMISVWNVIKKWHTGDLLVRLNSDVSEVVQMIGVTWMNFILTTIKLIASFAFLYVMDSRLALIVLAISPIFLLSKIYFRRMRKLNKEVKQAESELGAVMHENLKFRILIRSLGLIETRQNKYENKQFIFASLKKKALNFSLLTQTILKYTVNIGYITVFIWGVFRLHSGEITFGTMTAFLQLVAHIQSPILSLIAVVPAFVRFGVSADRILEIENVEVEPIVEQHPISEVRSIELKNVHFGYEDDLVLKGLNLNIKRGESVAVVGGSGKGKTTFIRLLLALLKPDSGEVLIEDDYCKKYIISTKHNVNFCYVPQGNTLFSGTIRENLMLNAINISQEQLKRAIYISCSEFIYDLPNGLDTVIGESGMGLSEGQAQRLSIARALIKGGEVLLFDECTSALDDNTRTMFMERIFSFSQDKIAIFVTHDMILAKRCDQTILIN